MTSLSIPIKTTYLGKRNKNQNFFNLPVSILRLWLLQPTNQAYLCPSSVFHVIVAWKPLALSTRWGSICIYFLLSYTKEESFSACTRHFHSWLTHVQMIINLFPGPFISLLKFINFTVIFLQLHSQPTKIMFPIIYLIFLLFLYWHFLLNLQFSSWIPGDFSWWSLYFLNILSHYLLLAFRLGGRWIYFVTNSVSPILGTLSKIVFIIEVKNYNHFPWNANLATLGVQMFIYLPKIP